MSTIVGLVIMFGILAYLGWVIESIPNVFERIGDWWATRKYR